MGEFTARSLPQLAHTDAQLASRQDTQKQQLMSMRQQQAEEVRRVEQTLQQQLLQMRINHAAQTEALEKEMTAQHAQQQETLQQTVALVSGDACQKCELPTACATYSSLEV